MRTRNVRSLVYLASGLGLIVALFAAAEFADPALAAVCSVNSFVSCGKVAGSGLTTIFGIPDYLWGVGGFVLILLAAALAEQRPSDRRRGYALLGVTTLGVAVALYLLYVELVEINALCLVCASAYALGAVAWVGSVELVRRAPDLADDGDGETEESGSER